MAESYTDILKLVFPGLLSCICFLSARKWCKGTVHPQKSLKLHSNFFNFLHFAAFVFGDNINAHFRLSSLKNKYHITIFFNLMLFKPVWVVPLWNTEEDNLGNVSVVVNGSQFGRSLKYLVLQITESHTSLKWHLGE